MRRFFRIAIRSLILLLIALSSAVTTMRFATHGREVRVPRFIGLTPAQAQQVAVSHGLILQDEGRFYSSEAPIGRIMSQIPAPDSRVRRGWRVRVAQSLGPQRAPIPNVIGQSMRAAEINVSRRGLELGEVAQAELASFPTGSVLAQSPSPEVRNVTSPRVSLLAASTPGTTFYVMPNLVGKRLSQVLGAIEEAEFPPPRIQIAASTAQNSSQELGPAGNQSALRQPSPDNASQVGLIVHQTPTAGAKISQSTQMTLRVAR